MWFSIEDGQLVDWLDKMTWILAFFSFKVYTFLMLNH